MPRIEDTNPARSGAWEKLFHIWAQDGNGKKYQISPPRSAAFVKSLMELILRHGLQQDGLTFWIERAGGKGGDKEDIPGYTDKGDLRLQALAVSKQPEPDRRGVVDPGLRACAGVRRPVTAEQIEKQIIDDFKKWTVFGLFMILGGFLVLLIHLVFLAM